MATQQFSKIYRFLIAFILIILFPTIAKAQLAVTKKVVATIPGNIVEGTVTISHDGEAYAFVIKTQEGERIVLNGKQQIPFSRISKPIFSPISNKLFYWALDNSYGKQEIVLIADGKKFSSDMVTEGSLYFSKDGKRWAAITGTSDGNVVVIIDGKKIEKYNDISMPTFSYDNKHIAFLVPKGLVIDGRKVKVFKKPEVDVSGEARVYVYGNMMVYYHINYLSDGSLIFLTKDKQGWTIYKNNICLASYRHQVIQVGRLFINVAGFEDASSIFTPINIADAAPYAIWWEKPEGNNTQWRVVRNGLPVDKIRCSKLWSESYPILSSDGKRWAYAAYISSKDKEELFVIVDGKKYGPYANVWGITFSKNGKRFAYAASDGSKWSYYIDGKKLKGKFDSVWPPQLSNNGRRFAWKAERADKVILIVDGNEVYVGKKPLKGPVFDKLQHVHWYTIEDNSLVHYTVK